MRENLSLEKDENETLKKLIILNLRSHTDFNKNLELIKNWFGDLVNVSDNIYEIFIEMAFNDSDSLRDILSRIQEYDIVRKTK